ncbi:MAG: hypothetical protein Q3X03_06315 [Eggerthellaceae bacterium]|nr:hypothetical protein [Eggerthellaceae bacterium]
MFHEITDSELSRRRKVRIIVACCLVALAVAACLIFTAAQQNAREQGAAALHDSIISAAKQCCAIEGSCPATLEHLEENYGLAINHDEYVVSYESFADNIMPTVVVTPK